MRKQARERDEEGFEDGCYQWTEVREAREMRESGGEITAMADGGEAGHC